MTDSPETSRARLPKRVDGKARREQILAAALRVIARDGVRAVRHRAVAKEAEVPLSATTYYFRDIHELIAEAFHAFAELSQVETGNLTQAMEAALARLADGSQSVGSQESLIAAVTAILLSHIDNQVKAEERRLVENAFRQEALRDPPLAQALHQSNRVTLATAEKLLAAAGSDDPETDAELLFAVVLHLEYRRVLAKDSPEERQKTARMVRRLFEKILK
ncbi:TetR family transcriptional regulator [Permianibacter sp. IMCC34836]|uniref:TetR/AcrR family transcriptional regulator n=1 Tax=Permianibacter fluminis TaxID=2738515 RepID=UPI001554782F|nr:TetR family transcriptional regulator [Permianibacter fluminis]NQD38877.1 TetR family transcriptional regulator [Permianibacter fluminis]